MKRILVVGSLNLDLVTKVKHIPVEGETVLGSTIQTNCGGKGSNQACAAGKLGAKVTMLGAIGQDQYAVPLIENLNKYGVNTSRIISRDDIKTSIAFITVNSEGGNSIVVTEGANNTLSVQDIDRNIDLFNQSEIIIFQLEIPVDTVIYGAKKAKELGKTVVLDPAPVPVKFPNELYQFVDVIKPNEIELGLLTRMNITEENILKATNILRHYGVHHVVVTLGENGVFVNSKQCGIQRILAKKVKSIDTTAAGDSFTAALALKLAEGRNVESSVRFANEVASVTVTREGAQSSIPTKEEIEFNSI